ncbi:MAG: hypothetical protein JWQ74_669 [Marmoricola sp.]|nr:hypothetical protein [Marmoricola sp.]
MALTIAAIPAVAHAQSTAPVSTARSAAGLVVRNGSWGPLKVGMTSAQAQKTGMVSTEAEHCSAGYEMTKKFRNRGYVVWTGTFPKMKVDQIIVIGAKDHTSKRIHVGSTLRQLRHAYPTLSKVYSSSELTGNQQSANDLYIAYAHKTHAGVLGFEFAYGKRPKLSSKIAMIDIAHTRTVYWGC